MEETKHKFKRMKRFVYMVMSKCEHCGIERKVIGKDQAQKSVYQFYPHTPQATLTDPGCTTTHTSKT